MRICCRKRSYKGHAFAYRQTQFTVLGTIVVLTVVNKIAILLQVFTCQVNETEQFSHNWSTGYHNDKTKLKHQESGQKHETLNT